MSEEELEEEEEEEEEDKHIGEGGDADALLTDTGEKKAKKLTKADLEVVCPLFLFFSFFKS